MVQGLKLALVATVGLLAGTGAGYFFGERQGSRRMLEESERRLETVLRNLESCNGELESCEEEVDGIELRVRRDIARKRDPKRVLVESSTRVSPGFQSVAVEGLIRRATVAGGGRLLVIQFQGGSRLGVYEPDRPNDVRYFDVGTSSFEFAAGGDTVVIQRGERRLVEVYDLRVGVRRASVVNTALESTLAMIMGHSNGEQALLVGLKGSQYRVISFDLRTLDFNPLRLSGSVRPHGRFVASDGDLSLVVLSGHGSPGFVGTRAGQSFQFKYIPEAHGPFAVGSDRVVYGKRGKRANPNGVVFDEIGYDAVPSVAGDAVVTVRSNGALFLHQGRDEPEALGVIPALVDTRGRTTVYDGRGGAPKRSIGDEIFYFQALERLVVVAHGANDLLTLEH